VYGVQGSLEDELCRREETFEPILDALGNIPESKAPPRNAAPRKIAGRSSNCVRQSKALFTFSSNSLMLSSSSLRWC
jgi:hypothetical protein